MAAQSLHESGVSMCTCNPKGGLLTQGHPQEDQVLPSSKRLMASALDKEQSQASLQVHHGVNPFSNFVGITPVITP